MRVYLPEHTSFNVAFLRIKEQEMTDPNSINHDQVAFFRKLYLGLILSHPSCKYHFPVSQSQGNKEEMGMFESKMASVL